MWQTLSQFYCSSQWRDFRRLLIAERLKDDGILYCEFSGKPLLNAYDIVLHHKQQLTPQNVNDYSVSLNPDNIMIVSQAAHNEIHSRFGYVNKKVYYVYGSPCSGKSTFVNNIKGNSDLIVDMGLIWQCITGEKYKKPNALKQNAFALRDCLMDQVKTRAGRWERAFIVTGGALKGERIRQIETLGAEPIFIDTPKDECLKRLTNSREKDVKLWTDYINQWWDTYQE